MRILLIFATIVFFTAQIARATQADDTTITIDSQASGVTPFISQLTLTASDTTVLKSIQFTVTPKTGSVTRPLSGTYAKDYLITRGYLLPPSTQIFLPVYGLYDGYTNTVTLTYYFLDGSSKKDSTTVTTSAYGDPCGYKTPNVLQARSNRRSLSYDYMMVKGACSYDSPAVIDTDGNLRWVGPGEFNQIVGTFFDNAFYQGDGPRLARIELDGTVTILHDYSDIDVTFLHHNIDRGKTGVIIDVDTTTQFESTNIEVDAAGNVLHRWDMATIISDAMEAGGDDPSEFVYPDPTDWFHNNGVAYNRVDDSIVVSSRENFVICLDYETGAIKWILGDPTKKWHEFPSLAKYALNLTPLSLPPIGQHAPSFTFDQNLLVLDNGYQSIFQNPRGFNRGYASPRKYQVDLESSFVTELWNYEMNQSIYSPICSSVYEDAPFNYLIDYAVIGGLGIDDAKAQLLGLDASGTRIFYYEYPTLGCGRAYNSQPLHLENTRFPTVGPQTLNLSTRGNIGSGENVLVAGFIVTGTKAKRVALRVLGPSLADAGVSGTLIDPVLTLYDSSRAVIATNDNWELDPTASELSADGLAPSETREAATIQDLAPGAYTVIAKGSHDGSGIGLVELYDLSPEATSKLANISTRARVTPNEGALIAGFIVGEVANSTIAIRALGPSLAPEVIGTLADPTITVYNTNGTVIASNDNWSDGVSALGLQENNLAPSDPAESAMILHPPAGAYSVVVSSAHNGSGVALAEVYDLNAAAAPTGR